MPRERSSVTAGGNFIRVRKNRPTIRDMPATQKTEAKARSESFFHSTIWPAAMTAKSVQTPKMRLRRAKYRPLMRSGTTSEMAEDHATEETLLAKVPSRSMPMNIALRVLVSEGSSAASPQGSAPSENVRARSWKVEK